MSREILDKPHPTPNPDGPHTGVSKRASDADAGLVQHQPAELVIGEAPSVSGADDDNVIMASAEPDPMLKSKSSSETIPWMVTESESSSAFLGVQPQQPRTSEVFQGFAPRDADVSRLLVEHESAADPALLEILSSPAAVFDQGLIKTSEGTTAAAKPEVAERLDSDDDQVVDARIPWALLLLMSYSSAVTLALTWVLWTGRSFQAASPVSANVSSAEVEAVPKVASTAPVGELPPLPAENIASLGQTVQLGELEITPLEIALAPVVLVRSIDPGDWRREDEPSLVLKLRLRNISKERSFAPLERRFLREQTSQFDRSTIVTSKAKAISFFPLAVESEWSIEGQAFGALKPEETVETLIASESGVKGKLADDMTWRIRLRIGAYRTDVLGVRFHDYDVNEPPAE